MLQWLQGAPAGDGGRLAPDAAAPEDEITHKLLRCVADNSGGKLEVDQINPAAHLFESGYLDSVSSAELLSLVEREFGLDLEEDQLLGRLNCIAALAQHIRQAAGS